MYRNQRRLLARIKQQPTKHTRITKAMHVAAVLLKRSVTVVTSTSSSNNTTSPKSLLFDHVECDNARLYNTRTGVFTLKRAGFYTVSAQCTARDYTTAPNGIHLILSVNGGQRTYAARAFVPDAIEDYSTVVIHKTLKLSQHDTVSFHVTLANGGVATALGGPPTHVTWAQLHEIR